MIRTLAILIFDEVEVLDACGPFEVFATTRNEAGEALFRVVTVAQEHRAVRAVGGLAMMPDHDFADCPPADMILVPGGAGRRRESENEALLQWIREAAELAELTLSVCTGSFLLLRAGLLEGRRCTTHSMHIEELRAAAPSTRVEEARWVDDGNIVSAGGISAGIDMSLAVVARLYDEATALRTARRMEYPMPEID